MLMLCFTYLQVMPEFIDFLLIFGKQTRPQHFHFGAFRQQARLAAPASQASPHSLKIPELDWSGRDFQLCYNVKSMEPSSQGDWPWSPRDCIINHTFELETTRIIWIIIKGNTLIQDRIRSATRYQSPGELSSFRTLEDAFASTLATHLLISEWAAENWDEFITFIETKYHEISRRAMSNDIDIPPVIISEGGDGPLSNTKRTNTEKSAKSGLSSFSRTRMETFDSWSSLIKGDKAWFPKPDVNLVTDSKDRVRPPAKKTMRVEFETPGQQEFTFSDLQSLHHLHDRAKEAILILKLNIKIMSQLVKFYGTTIPSQQFPAALRNCVGEYNVFRGRIEAIQDDLHTYVLKLETLVGHVEGCKALVRSSGILVKEILIVNSFVAFWIFRTRKVTSFLRANLALRQSIWREWPSK